MLKLPTHLMVKDFRWLTAHTTINRSIVVAYTPSLQTIAERVGKLQLKAASETLPRGQMDWVYHKLWRPVRHGFGSDDGRSTSQRENFRGMRQLRRVGTT